jgi:hypothetical protein
VRIKAAEAELVKLRAKTKSDTKTIEDLTKERAVLIQKVRDRDEELRGKARFLEVSDILNGLTKRLLMFARMSKMR